VLRRLVSERAERLCEYCLIHEDDTFFGCQIEHVIAEKHGGATVSENLAFACVFCNSYKGTDIASLSPLTGQLIRLFNPRNDRWADHFRLIANEMRIEGITEVGQTTVRLLQMNHPDRLLERSTLRDANRYPVPAARALIDRRPS